MCRWFIRLTALFITKPTMRGVLIGNGRQYSLLPYGFDVDI